MNLDQILPHVRRPSRYMGNEFNVVRKDWDQCDLRAVFAFPDLYEIGMSHLGLQILAQIVNRLPWALAERAYVPDLDMESLLRQEGLPLFSLESRRPLAEFDLLGITLPYELCYTNILTILDLAGIPLAAADRGEGMPLVIGGGPCAFHPEPVAPFFDAILLGDGEEAITEIVETVRQGKKAGCRREELLRRLDAIEGVYVPALFAPRYGEAGEFLGTVRIGPGKTTVRRRILPDLDTVPQVFPPIASPVKIIHDRLGVEIARGCTRGCRYCQAGMIYRPVRERACDTVLDYALTAVRQAGFEEVALLSLSTGDYSCKARLIETLMDRLYPERISLSLPSLRVGTLDRETMQQIRRVKKTGFTLAPEAGTERLRRIINKGISEEELLTTARNAFALGWKLIKLYFMFGLPWERDEDFQEIAGLAMRVLKQAPARGRCEVTVSAALFVPKPHTPFQWSRQISAAEGKERVRQLKVALRQKGLALRWHDPLQSCLEGVLSRGDRRLSQLIEAAWRKGARLDCWSEHFHFAIWEEAAQECGISFDSYLDAIDPASPLPWDHLDAGVSKAFFLEELARAGEAELTPDCRTEGCQGCGLCDFDRVQPVIHSAAQGRSGQWPVTSGELKSRENTVRLPYVFHYSRTGDARFFGHLEMIQVFFRALRRVHLPLCYSQGHNPLPRLTFSGALPVGTESLAEWIAMDLDAPLADMEATQQLLNINLPAGIEITDVAAGKAPEVTRVEAGYRIVLPGPVPRERLEQFALSQSWPIARLRKGKTAQIDIKPLVSAVEITGTSELRLVLLHDQAQQGVKPIEIVAALCELTEKELAAARITKLWVRGCREGGLDKKEKFHPCTV